MFPVLLKWEKKKIDGLELNIDDISAFQAAVQARTDLPPERQKLLCKNGWKGVLGPGSDLSRLKKSKNSGTGRPLQVLLVGSSGKIPVSQSPLQERGEATADSCSTGVVSAPTLSGLLPVVEVQPSDQQLPAAEPVTAPFASLGSLATSIADEQVIYSRVARGLSQARIQQLLSAQQRTSVKSLRLEPTETKDQTTSSDTIDRSRGLTSLFGICVMSLGLELSPHYINCLCGLSDGTLVTGSDHGHLQLWKHTRRLCEILHSPNGKKTGGVLCVAPISLTVSGTSQHAAVSKSDAQGPGPNFVGFASGGAGLVNIWDASGTCLRSLVAPLATDPFRLLTLQHQSQSPRATAMVTLAALLRPVRAAFQMPRLPLAMTPDQQQRVAQLRAQYAREQERLHFLSSSIQLWHLSFSAATGMEVKEELLTVSNIQARMTPLTALVSFTTPVRSLSDTSSSDLDWKSLSAHDDASTMSDLRLVAGNSMGEIFMYSKESSSVEHLNSNWNIISGLAGGMNTWKCESHILLMVEKESSTETSLAGRVVRTMEHLSIVAMELLEVPSLTHGKGKLALAISVARSAPDGQSHENPLNLQQQLGNGGQATQATTTTTTQVSIPDFGPGGAVVLLDLHRWLHAGTEVRSSSHFSSWLVLAVLAGHPTDNVEQLCALPTGALVTCGGKLDGSLQLWEPTLWHPRSQGHQVHIGGTGALAETKSRIVRSCSRRLDVGYCLALNTLRTDQSGHFALVASKYNIAKICL